MTHSIPGKHRCITDHLDPKENVPAHSSGCSHHSSVLTVNHIHQSLRSVLVWALFFYLLYVTVFLSFPLGFCGCCALLLP